MSYDLVQTTFLFSLAANGASSIQGTQSELEQYFKAFLLGGKSPIGVSYPGFLPFMNPQLAGGDWELVWGGAIVLPPLLKRAYGANAALVVRSESLNTYVVAISATNPKSVFDWAVEDGNVAYSLMAKWPITLPFVPRFHATPILLRPAVSAATGTGVGGVLRRLTDPATGKTLREFLKRKVKDKGSDKATLIFTGHSLAGALAPAVAHYLYPEPKASGWGKVLVLPSAGATPGNHRFSSLWSKAYRATPLLKKSNPAYAVWNVDHASNRDIVPHAWDKLGALMPRRLESGQFDFVFGVLGESLGRELRAGVLAAQALSALGDYTALPQNWFDPEWGGWEWKRDPDHSYVFPPKWKPAPVYTEAKPLTTAAQLLEMVNYTHADQYMRYFQVIPPPLFPIAEEKAVPEVTADDHLNFEAAMQALAVPQKAVAKRPLRSGTRRA